MGRVLILQHRCVALAGVATCRFAGRMRGRTTLTGDVS
ncbi:hypothetical protein AZ78_0585 [Lysobacter capsici AZ78]|uniref:Uncharacterized protein n=1 Tax=Lysobacter capsici AZ78 TaxID=1444315 RepID=A0A108U5Q5_9GAMM|nr:hypothetical protein AZ78_0585 [Lysobacter capsici AZ78]